MLRKVGRVVLLLGLCGGAFTAGSLAYPTKAKAVAYPCKVCGGVIQPGSTRPPLGCLGSRIGKRYCYTLMWGDSDIDCESFGACSSNVGPEW